ncbi:MAG: SRPBCC domain-containing protein [Chloroflexi bacterium]|nr:SRPBCC domain-containing protein [Chloroflexota bacterium]
MPKTPAPLIFTRSIAAPAAQVYQAFTTAHGFREWLVKMAEAGTEHLNYLFLLWEDSFAIAGRFEDLQENARVVLAWRGPKDPRESRVTVTLVEKDGQTELTLEHDGLGSGGDWEDIRADVQARWEKGLDNLKDVLETGMDRRIYQRPMMGILIGQFITPEVAEKRGLPIRYGHQIAGVLPEMGAGRAGLQKDDIILSLDGIPLKDWGSLDQAIRPHLAGEDLAVEYLRGEQVHTVKFQLGSKAKPVIPLTAQALSEAMAGIYSNANAKIQEALEGATDVQLEHRPASQEWNVKEALAHLILADRDMLTWASSLVLGKEVAAYNSQAHSRLKGLVRRYPAAPALMNQLEFVQDETTVFLADLPAEFIERKASYTRVAAEYMEGTPYHYKDHLEQIEKNLAAARNLN